jgi:hypothetical protein
MIVPSHKFWMCRQPRNVRQTSRGCFCKKYIGGANNLREADVIVMSSGAAKLFQFILY